MRMIAMKRISPNVAGILAGLAALLTVGLVVAILRETDRAIPWYTVPTIAGILAFLTVLIIAALRWDNRR